MAIISELKSFGELSQASYADLQSGMFSSSEENPDTNYIDLLKREEMTLDQATAFSSRYRVLTTSQEYGIGDFSGFDAVLFEDTQDNNKKILAIRGTSSVLDLIADINLLSVGSAYRQVEDMEAFYVALIDDTVISSDH
jgi:hypothetical protein